MPFPAKVKRCTESLQLRSPPRHKQSPRLVEAGGAVGEVVGGQHLAGRDVVAPGDGEQLLPRLGVADAERHLRVGGGQGVAQLHRPHERGRLPRQHRALGPDGEGHIQRAARAGALQVLNAQPALGVGVGVGREVGGEGQGVVQRLFVALHLPEGVFRKGRHHGPGREERSPLLPRQAHRPEGREAG